MVSPFPLMMSTDGPMLHHISEFLLSTTNGYKRQQPKWQKPGIWHHKLRELGGCSPLTRGPGYALAVIVSRQEEIRGKILLFAFWCCAQPFPHDGSIHYLWPDCCFPTAPCGSSFTKSGTFIPLHLFSLNPFSSANESFTLVFAHLPLCQCLVSSDKLLAHGNKFSFPELQRISPRWNSSAFWLLPGCMQNSAVKWRNS